MVVDDKGEPLPGVTILVAGSTRGVITDENGSFVIDNVPVGTKLEAFFLGMEKQILEFQGKELMFALKPKAGELDEVVVVGYGTQRKVSVIAAITTIEPAKLSTGTSRSLSNNLAGNLGGIIGVQRSGEPGYDNSDFWIRGISTFSGSTSPLVLIDGIERSLNNIDVQEIESLSVLKDASASAVYGVRGANGVILITKDYASNTRTTLDINGGTEMLRYSFIAAYYHEDGILEMDKEQEWDSGLRLNRFNLRSNVDVNVSKTTLLRFNIGGYLQDRIGPPQSIDDLFAGRASYTYDGRYIAEFNFGYNGSENFAKGKRYGFFPSIAAGWLLSEELFMEPVYNIFSKIKLRVSHGLAGNDQVGGRRFAYLTTNS